MAVIIASSYCSTLIESKYFKLNGGGHIVHGNNCNRTNDRQEFLEEYPGAERIKLTELCR